MGLREMNYVDGKIIFCVVSSGVLEVSDSSEFCYQRIIYILC